MRTTLRRCPLPLALLLAVIGKGQPAPVFRANAQLGVPARVGSITIFPGTREAHEIGAQREVTLESAELALVFPNRVENAVAMANEKLLILRGSLRNPEKTSTIHLGPSSVIGLRLAQRYTGTAGKFQFIGHFDPETGQHVQHKLKGGESARFAGVWRIPADFDDFRLGVTSDRPNIIAWYDLRAAIRPLPPPSDSEIDGLEIGPVGLISQPSPTAANVVYTVQLKVTNRRLLLPARWGWQYFTAELLCADGSGNGNSAVKAYPDMIDAATGRSWVGDLPPGGSVVSLLQFHPGGPRQPRSLRLTMNATGRAIEITLRPL